MRKEEFGLILNLAQVRTHVLNFLVDARNSATPCAEGSSKHPVVPGAHSLVGKKEVSINRSHRKKKKNYGQRLQHRLSLFWRVEEEETVGDLVSYFQSIYKAVVGQC